MATSVSAATWFESRARFSVPVGVVPESSGVRLLDRDEQVTISLPVWESVLAAASRFASKPRLVVDDLQVMPRSLFPWCLFEVKAWEDATGERWEGDTFARVSKALDLLSAHYTNRYFDRLGLPWRKLDLSLDGRRGTDSAVRWQVRYPDLWLRIMASRISDPLVLRALLHENPHVALASALGETRPDTAVAAIYWAALLFDKDAFDLAFPEKVEALEATDLFTLRRKVTAQFPSLVAESSLFADTLWSRPFIETAYGRSRERPERKADALSWWISGTAEDILRCMAVTAERCADEGVTVIGTDLRSFPVPTSPAVYGFVERERALWWSNALETLAHLGNPLGWVSLNPQIEVAI